VDCWRESARDARGVGDRIFDVMYRKFGVSTDFIYETAAYWLDQVNSCYKDAIQQAIYGHCEEIDSRNIRLAGIEDEFDIYEPEYEEDIPKGERQWDIEGIKLKLDPLILGGPYKSLKTLLAIDMQV
jgi:hypothetical protein